MPGILLTLAQTAFVLTLALIVAGRFGRLGKYFELASHFRLQYLVALFVCGVVFLAFGAWLWGALAAAGFIALGASLFPFYAPRAMALNEGAKHDLRLLLFNVNHRNARYSEFLDLVGREQPDIIIAQEVTPRWVEALEGLGGEFPTAQLRRERPPPESLSSVVCPSRIRR